MVRERKDAPASLRSRLDEDLDVMIVKVIVLIACFHCFFIQEELFLRVGGKDTNVNKGIAFLKGSLFDLESSSVEQPPLTANAEEFIRKNSEANVLSRFGAMFFEYLYAMEIENDEDSGYYESAPAVKEESYQRIIVGPSMLEVTIGVVHRMEMVMKLAEDDANSRKGKYGTVYRN